jgi:hypothetical protein
MVSTCLQARVVIVYVTAERLSFLESNIMCSRQDFFADPIQPLKFFDSMSFFIKTFIIEQCPKFSKFMIKNFTKD